MGEWVPDVTFLQLRMFSRAQGGSACFVISKRKFRQFLKDEVELRRWCDRFYSLQRQHFFQSQFLEICQLLNREDFSARRSIYMSQIYYKIREYSQSFYDQADWGYYLDDIKERGAEKNAMFERKNKSSAKPETTRDRTWDY